jgi:hypothetical protein
LVDSTDLIVIASVAQTIVITLTLVIFIFQFRSQEKSIRESAYQNLMGRYTDYIKMVVDKPELGEFRNFTEGVTLPGGGELEKLKPNEQVIFAHLLLGYGIFEEVYLLHKKKWIDDDTWDQWAVFLQKMSKHPLYGRVRDVSHGTFDKDFEDYVSKIMGKDDRTPNVRIEKDSGKKR